MAATRELATGPLTLEESLRGDPCALGHCCELGPYHVFGDPAHACRGVEPAIGASHHALWVSDGPRDVFEPVRDDLGVFNKAGQIVDHAGGDDLVVGEWKFLQDAILVLMPGIGERKYEPADVSLLEERQYVGERDIAIMRSLVNFPSRRGVALGRVAR